MTQPRTIAALYVSPKGSYINVPGVDPWPEDRDARLYRGPYPVVAHSPCQRWGKFWAGQPLYIKQTGIRKVKGDDGGCFKAALAAIRRWGGVLEHPCDSHAWDHFELNKPPRSGGWITADDKGGWTCCVEQGRYGHYARKPTWLLVYHCDLPELDWGISEAKLDPAIVARMGFKRAQRLGEVGGKGGGKDSAPRIGTPAPFRELLLSIARTAALGSAEAATAIESECCREDVLAWEPCPPFQELQAEIEELRAGQKLLTLSEIERTIGIEFNHSEDSASVRRAAERVFNLQNARAGKDFAEAAE